MVYPKETVGLLLILGLASTTAWKTCGKDKNCPPDSKCINKICVFRSRIGGQIDLSDFFGSTLNPVGIGEDTKKTSKLPPVKRTNVLQAHARKETNIHSSGFRKISLSSFGKKKENGQLLPGRGEVTHLVPSGFDIDPSLFNIMGKDKSDIGGIRTQVTKLMGTIENQVKEINEFHTSESKVKQRVKNLETLVRTHETKEKEQRQKIVSEVKKLENTTETQSVAIVTLIEKNRKFVESVRELETTIIEKSRVISKSKFKDKEARGQVMDLENIVKELAAKIKQLNFKERLVLEGMGKLETEMQNRNIRLKESRVLDRVHELGALTWTQTVGLSILASKESELQARAGKLKSIFKNLAKQIEGKTTKNKLNSIKSSIKSLTKRLKASIKSSKSTRNYVHKKMILMSGTFPRGACKPRTALQFVNQLALGPLHNINRVYLERYGWVAKLDKNKPFDIFFHQYRFAPIGLTAPHFQIDIKVRWDEDLPEDGQVALVTNGNHKHPGTVALSVDKNNFYFQVTIDGHAQALKLIIPMQAAGNEAVDGWYTLKLVYRMHDVFKGSVGTITETITDKNKLNAPIAQSFCPIRFGEGYGFRTFKGYLDYIHIWTCNPESVRHRGRKGGNISV